MISSFYLKSEALVRLLPKAADLMQQHRLAALAAAEFRDKVVQTLLGLRRNGAVAEGTDRRGFHGNEVA